MRRFLTVLAVMLLTACQTQPFSVRSVSSDPVLVIRGGTSFGECLGYCRNEIQITREQTRLVRNFTTAGGPAAPDLLYHRPTDPADWQRLLDLVEFDRFQALESVYGCPDCADGGAEWIEIETATASRKVTFEYGETVEPISVLIETVRSLRQDFLESVEQ